MGKKEKLIKKLLSKPKDFTWDELTTLLGFLGYILLKKGKTGGSRVRFTRGEGNDILLHKPHPKKILKEYVIKRIIDTLSQEGLI